MAAPTYTYTYAPSSDEVDRMRLLLGDTGGGSPSSTTCIFCDEELQYFFDNANDNANLAAHDACMSAAAMYSSKADRTLGPMSISYSQIAASFREQAEAFLEGATNTYSVTPEPYSFTSETGERDTSLEDDTTLQVPAKFYRDQYEDGSAHSDRDHSDW
jgi:hypothetical protein